MRAYFERLERCGYVKPPGWLAKLATLLHLPARFGGNPRHGYRGWLSTQIADAKLVIPDPELLEVVVDAAASALTESLGRR